MIDRAKIATWSNREHEARKQRIVTIRAICNKNLAFSDFSVYITQIFYLKSYFLVKNHWYTEKIMLYQ